MNENIDNQRKKVIASFRDPFPLIVGGFMHELKNILCTVVGPAQVIDMSMKDSDKNKDAIKMIIESSRLLDKILEYLHSLAKYFYDEDEPFCQTTITDLIKIVRSRLLVRSENFKWSAKGIKKIPKLNFPPQILYFIIAEIVRNAYKISKCNDIELCLNMEFQYLQNENLLKIIATDNGPGYPNEFVKDQHIQDKTKAGGLYMIIETVRRLNGWVSIGNKSNGGAMLLIALPAKIE